jgi:hypothetical protein
MKTAAVARSRFRPGCHSSSPQPLSSVPAGNVAAFRTASLPLLRLPSGKIGELRHDVGLFRRRGLGELDRRTTDLERVLTRLADVEKLVEASADVTALISLISDRAAAKKRLAELVKATQEVEAGRAQLAADRGARGPAPAE